MTIILNHNYTMSCDDKLYREKVIGRVTERQHSSLHEIAKLSNLKQTNFKWHRGRKLGEWEGWREWREEWEEWREGGRSGGKSGGREEWKKEWREEEGKWIRSI